MITYVSDVRSINKLFYNLQTLLLIKSVQKKIFDSKKYYLTLFILISHNQ